MTAQLHPFVAGLLGGLLIGGAAALMLLVQGRIAGISGIAGAMLRRPDGDTLWRAAFLLGLIAGPVLYALGAGGFPTVTLDARWPVIGLGGLLVGFGTRMGSGCTSGHGVCGLARLSPRSLVAVAVFMLSAGLTVALVRHGIPR